MPHSSTELWMDSPRFRAMCEAVLGAGSHVRFHVRGMSMQPNLLEGDLVIVGPVSVGALKKGDVVLTQNEDGLRVHRVVEMKTTGGIITRGDAGQENDLATQQVLGRVIKVERDGQRAWQAQAGQKYLDASRTLARRLKLAAAARLKKLTASVVLLGLALTFGILFSPAPAAAQNADLAVTVDTAAPNPVAPGGTITYTVTVINNGPANATTPTVTMVIPTNTTYVSFTRTGGTGTWNCAGVNPGGTGTLACTRSANMGTGAANGATFSIIVAVNTNTAGNTTISQIVSIASTTNDPTPGNNSASVNVTVNAADLALTQAANPTVVQAGSTITYTLTLTNKGANTASNAVVYQQTPPNTTFGSVTITPDAGGNWTCTSPVLPATTGQILCSDANNFPNGAVATFAIVVNVGAATPNGTVILNSADTTSTTADPNPTNNASTSSVLVENPADADLAVSMTASPTPVFVSSTLTYTIVVQNLGLGNAANAQLVDTMPAGTSASGFTTTLGSCSGTTTVTCNFGTLNNGNSATVTISLTTPTSPGALNNSATVSTTTTDPVASNNTATVVTVVQPLVCATPGKDGSPATPITGIVNAYYPPSAAGTLAAGATSVALGAAAPGGSQTAIASGDLLLIIQMQDADINSTNTSSYGHGTPGEPASGWTNLNNSGNFEFVTATNAVPVAGGTLDFTGTGPTGGLLNTYTSAPAIASTSLGTATAASWANGIASFTFPTPLPAGIVPSSALTTAGFTPAGYNLTAAAILSVNTITGVITVSLTTNPGAETALGTGSFVTQGQRTYQVIRVPQYASATLSSGLTAMGWNGATGGVLAIDVSSQLTLGGTVAVDALGFRGGGGRILTGGTGTATDYVTLATDATNGSKGEGIAGTPRYVVSSVTALTQTPTNTGIEGYPNGSYSRGAPGNAGGGATDADPPANDQNSGGGGGGNGGPGGQGGFGWNSAGIVGGFGGSSFPGTSSAMIMGGGGGAGTTNNGTWWSDATQTGNHDCGANCTGIYSSGAAGGGIVIMHAGAVAGTGTITANGSTALDAENDGGGGGGSGGSIRVLASSGGLGGLTVIATGGGGGDTWPAQAPGTPFPGNRHGTGGGGGGGALFLSGTPAAASNVAGGSPGASTTALDPYGATVGASGTVVTTYTIPQTPGTQPGSYCASADLSVTNSGAPAVVVAGNNIAYTQGVTNNGPMAAVNAVFSETIPANTTFFSIDTSLAPGWTCSVPGVGGTGIISCTNPLVANGASAIFTMVVKVNAGTTVQTQITDVDSVTSGTSDPNLANNTASVTTIVGTATSANLAVTNTATPNPVQAGNNISYTQVVTDNGPAAAANVSFTETLPANTTFVSMTTPAGWSCSTPSVGSTGTITCTIASLAAGSASAATFNPVLKVNAGTASGTVISDVVNVTSTSPEPNPTSNSATANVVVASAGQADMAVTASISPNPVLAGNSITLTQTVTNNGPAAAATDTFTETIPATASFVSLGVPAGWSCTTPGPGLSGAISCNIASDAANNVSNFPLVIKALSSDTPGTSISLTPTVGSATSDPNTNNNKVTLTTYVASPTQADMAIIKTASPEPVDQNTNLVYTLQITNNGPATAQGVVVTDNLPTADVTFVSASTTQPSPASCTTNTISQTTPYPSTLQVSCNIGSVGVGNLVIVTINVTANTFSSSTTATNTATVSATTGDPNLTNNSSTAISTIQAPTAIQLVSFRAMPRAGGGTVLEWRTREEIHNLGFNVYREDSSGRHRLNPSLIAGSALILRGSQPQHAAKTYRWIDPHPTSGAIYWLEDVDLGGAHNSHGPAQPESATQAAPASMATAPLLAQANRLAGPVSRSQTSATRVSKLAEFQRPATLPDTSVEPINLDNDRAVQISIQQEGWYRVTLAQLVAAGFHPNVNARTLQLFAEGVEQPILIDGNPSGILGINDAIEFYGTGIDTPYSGTRVYWLVPGKQAGKRVELAPKTSGNSQPASFPAVAVREDRTTYFAALLNSEDQDNFFGAILTSTPTDQELDVVHSVPSNMPLTLDVTLQGVTDQQDHSVSVVFNGSFLGNMNFSNMSNFNSTFSVDPSLVQDGANTVTLTALDGDNDVSLVQSIVLHYAHSFTADNDLLRMSVGSGSQVHASGFSNGQVRVFDVTDPLAVDQLPAAVQSEASSYSIDFAVPGSSAAGQNHLLLAVAGDQIAAPSAVALHAPSNLSNWREGASEIIITHPDFVPNLAPLVRLREEQGLSVKVVTVDEIFDAYNYGERSPYAIRTFLQNGIQRWRIHPQFVLLMGDGSLDPRNYLGFGDFDFVPTRLIDTAAFKTASDDWFTDFNQTGFQTIPTGRLPVDTPADADLVISKIVGYERGIAAGAWNQQVLVVADQNAGVNFSTTADSVVSNFGNSLNITEILGSQLDPQTAKQQILDAINSGQAIVNYTGHGSVEQWSFSDLLDDSDAATLQNGDKLPVFLLMDCLNGFFQDVYTESLAESLLLSPNGGAVAVWASSGFTDAGPQAAMDLTLTQLLASNPRLPLGKAILISKSGVRDNDVRRTWILFGDPAMHIQLAVPGLPAPSSGTPTSPVKTPPRRAYPN